MKIAGFWKSSPQLLWTNGYRDIMIQMHLHYDLDLRSRSHFYFHISLFNSLEYVTWLLVDLWDS